VPTLLRIEGFRFSFYSGDGVEPAHVHVAKGDAAAKVWLQPVRMQYAHGFSAPELRRLREITAEHEAIFLERWNEYFSR
jgi:Domain of unknown function (DUF4160)